MAVADPDELVIAHRGRLWRAPALCFVECYRDSSIRMSARCSLGSGHAGRHEAGIRVYPIERGGRR